MKNVLLFLFVSISAFAVEKPVYETCLSTREYITTLEFLRDEKVFTLTETQSRELADKVSQGCTGSSKRFIQVSELLMKAQMDAKTAAQTGIKFALDTDDATGAFITIFKGSFVQDLLDMDLSTSLKVALALSHEFKGDRKLAMKDFNSIVEFCVNQSKIGLPLKECAERAAKITQAGEFYPKGVAPSFIKLYEYLTTGIKDKVPAYEALKLSMDVVSYGEKAQENFVQAYEYALAKKGLDLPHPKALETAKALSSRSQKKI